MSNLYEDDNRHRSKSQIKSKYIFNSVNLSKNNKPLDLDIESLCEDLYSVRDSKKSFLKMMSELNKDVLCSDIDKGNQIVYYEPEQFEKEKEDNSNKDNYFRHRRSSNQSFNSFNNYNSFNSYNGRFPENKSRFCLRKTIPEGVLLQNPIFRQNNKHKRYTDVNANSNYYFPKENNSIEFNKGQWMNRANQICINAQSMSSFPKLYETNDGNNFGQSNFGRLTMTGFPQSTRNTYNKNMHLSKTGSMNFRNSNMSFGNFI